MNARGSRGVEPRLLGRAEAAAYCGLSIPTFTSTCPVIPIKIRARVLYDRVAIDRWLDGLSGANAESLPQNEWLRRLDDAHARKGH